jgi:hypothetical protein
VVAVVGVLGRDSLALPIGQPVSEGAVAGGQVGDPPVYLAGRLVRGEGEFVALGPGGGLGFGGAQRREVLAGVAAAQFGVGGDGQVALGVGGGIPVGAVGHDRREDGLALPVGLLQGLVAGGQLELGHGVVVVAALSGGADLAQLVPDVGRGPGGLDRVSVAQVQQPAVGHAADGGSVGRAEGGQGLVPGGAGVGRGCDRSGTIGSAGSLWPDSSRQAPIEAAISAAISAA